MVCKIIMQLELQVKHIAYLCHEHTPHAGHRPRHLSPPPLLLHPSIACVVILWQRSERGRRVQRRWERGSPTLEHPVVLPELGEGAWGWGEEELRRPVVRVQL